ncbi:MAG: hypothetical protein HY270_15110 [Deltaproteobacteria bacterium]|nr:hypothetical protein [Deltaproteobacteria bacterium]
MTASGCATYVDSLDKATRATSAGNYEEALVTMNGALDVPSADELPNQWKGDRPLIALERGSLQQSLGRYRGAARDLSAAEGNLELLDLSTDPVGTLGSYIFSDSLKTYRTPPTERLSVNAINMLNYLAVGDLDGAAVEARRFQVMRDYLAAQNIQADRPAALGTYLAGFTFEHRGEGDRALRYYEEALGGGRLESLDGAVSRLARANPYRGPRLSQVLSRNGKQGGPTVERELLVVLALGRVPHREPKRIPVGLAVGMAGTYVSHDINFLKYGASKVVVYPELVSTPSTLGEPAVQVDGEAVQVEELADLGSAIRQEYEEMKPKIIAAALTRMASRAAIAEGIRAGGRQQSDLLGDILSILFESALVAFDRPDTRSWTLLPSRILVARVVLKPGAHDVTVGFGGRSNRTVTVDAANSDFATVVVTEPR